nr:NEL domain-containing protein [Pseudomonas fragi]
MPDELEIHLAYRIGLARALELPGQPESMVFKSLAGVTREDLDIARLEVERAEKTAALNIFISTRQFWREYLIRTNRPQYSALTEP